MDILNIEEHDIKIIEDNTKHFIKNLKLIHNRIGYDKNTLKFIDTFKNEIIELLTMFNLNNEIVFLYNYDDKNKLFYEQYIKINEN